MVYPRFLWFLEHHYILFPFHFDFLSFRSTTEPLLHLNHDIWDDLSTRDYLLVVFFDLEKTYD